MPIKGLDDLSKKLEQLANNAKDLENKESASLTGILTPEFVSQNTKFSSADEFFEASGVDVSTQAAFEATPEDQLDAFVRSVSSFGSWREMLNSAGAAWAKRKLGL